jgi:glycyl-tRNA synthetase beta chain
MRWGGGTLRWVRPLKRILCLFDGQVVPFAIDGIESGDLTEGHRFMGEDHAPFAVTDFDDYVAKLRARYVVLDAAERKSIILERSRAVCAARGLELVEDEGLLDEVAGLVEWPAPVLGDMDAAFLDLPAEVIRTSMRVHQRYFAVRDPATAKLAPHFLVVANIEATDGGAVIAHGNARVLTARLSDARFFWTEDQKPGAVEAWLKKLNGVTFHAKLGTMAQRVERIAGLAEQIAPGVGAAPNLAGLAARLCKADLASGMVGEFPELQGVMGGYYVRQTLAKSSIGSGLSADEIDAVADAVRDHYKPLGPSDSVQTLPVTVTVALADKLDTLVGFFATDEKPTGSRDPFGLRRAALGVIRILLDSDTRLPLRPIFDVHYYKTASQLSYARVSKRAELIERVERHMNVVEPIAVDPLNMSIVEGRDTRVEQDQLAHDLLAFFADRLKVLLRDEGKRHDLVDAVFALGDDDLVRIVARVEALDGFLRTDDGASLLAGYKRASNILRIEEKKDAATYAGAPEALPGSAPEEAALMAALAAAAPQIDASIAQEDYTGAMIALSKLRRPLDDFFDKVFVNDPDFAVRRNRLLLLSQIRAAADRVADFSRIAGYGNETRLVS